MTSEQYETAQNMIREFLTDPKRIRELKDRIATHEQLLRDCLDRKPSLALRRLSEQWAGTPEIDFDVVTSVVRYELEDDRDDLWKAERAVASLNARRNR